ncbi:MAG: D-alanine--D-alanine ligase [Desulfatiglandaceae bacterium]
MTEKIIVALLSGGESPEREVSFKSGDQVYAALDKSKYEVIRYDPKTDLQRLVKDAGEIDVALIMLHGPYGEDGTIQGLMDLLHIPYQGSGVLGSAVAMNKIISKRLYSEAGIPTPGFIALEKGTSIDAEAVFRRLGSPVVIKPACCGSSVGMSIVETSPMLHHGIEEAWSHDDAVMIEEYVEGIELTVGVLGNDALEPFPVIEIIPDKDHVFFDYEAKYTSGVTQEICPARIGPILTEKAQELGLASHRALACKGYSRTDMILREDKNEIFVLETNTIPGMTETSLLPLAAKTAGVSFSKLLDRLIELALEEKPGQIFTV